MSKNNWERWRAFKKILSERIEDELNKTLNILKEIGVINSPEYWMQNAVKGKTVKGEYAAVLLERVAKFIRQKEGR
jgi:hypothetical protein